MEVVFCNTDYEEKLFSDNPHQIVSNAKNQQLEFLAWLLGFETIYTQRKYEKSYLDYIYSLVGLTPKTVNKAGKISFIWGVSEPLEEMRRLNSKITSTEFAIKNNLAHSSTRFSNSNTRLEDSELAKSPFSFSGRGHIVSKEKLDPKQIYIFEKRLNRVMDFSTLRFKNKSIFYKNIVDEFFQYKGTIIYAKCESPDFLEKDIASNYLKDIELITSYFDSGLDFQESYSIDSFLYLEDGKKQLYSLCEINYRSTMGKMAYLLSKRFFKDKACHFLVISQNNKEIPLHIDALKLSPPNNRLHLYLIAGANEEDVTSLARGLEI